MTVGTYNSQNRNGESNILPGDCQTTQNLRPTLKRHIGGNSVVSDEIADGISRIPARSKKFRTNTTRASPEQKRLLASKRNRSPIISRFFDGTQVNERDGQMLKGIFIGQAPSKGRDNLPALEGRAKARLAALAGLEPENLWSVFDRTNVLSRFPGRICETCSIPIPSCTSTTTTTTTTTTTRTSASRNDSRTTALAADDVGDDTIKDDKDWIKIHSLTTATYESVSSMYCSRHRPPLSTLDPSDRTSKTKSRASHSVVRYKGDIFPLQEAREAAANLRGSLHKYNHICMLP